MEKIHASALEAENRVKSLQTDAMRLQLYQNMLTNISTQATLLLGFALATFGADLLPYILGSDSEFCLFKTESSMFFGSVFLLANTCGCCLSLLVILMSSYLILRSQTALLYVGGAAAVWRTLNLSVYVYKWYGMALVMFIVDAMLLMWIFLGFSHFADVETPANGTLVNSWEVSGDFTTYGGRHLLTCIDPQNDRHIERLDSFG